MSARATCYRTFAYVLPSDDQGVVTDAARDAVGYKILELRYTDAILLFQGLFELESFGKDVGICDVRGILTGTPSSDCQALL